MITVEQIQLLESRVTKAVRKIETLQDENGTLRDRLARYEKRIEELEILINEFKDSQNDIEQGILNALSQLDELEDQVTGDTENSPSGQSDGTPGAATGSNQGSAGNQSTGSNQSDDQSQETSDKNPEAVHASDARQQPEAAPHGEAGESESSSETDAEEEQGVELDIF